MDELHIKYEKLKELLRSYGSVAVAFSGGVDSTFLMRVAHDVLGDRALAITAVSGSLPTREKGEGEEFCRANGIRLISCVTDEMSVPGYRENPPDRCYYCKHCIFDKLWKIARENGINILAEGSNTDDMGDYRPGRKAIKELGVASPLLESGLSKADIRALSKELGLPTWSKPSAACLASRFVYGEAITEEKLSMVDRAEALLHDLGFVQVRVRVHGNLARIETDPAEIERLMSADIRGTVYDKLKEYGFGYVTVDLRGYRVGSMNETLSAEEKAGALRD